MEISKLSCLGKIKEHKQSHQKGNNHTDCFGDDAMADQPPTHEPSKYRDALIGNANEYAHWAKMRKIKRHYNDGALSRLLSRLRSISSGNKPSHEEGNNHTYCFGDDGKGQMQIDKDKPPMELPYGTWKCREDGFVTNYGTSRPYSVNSITTGSNIIVRAHVSREVNRNWGSKDVMVCLFDEDVDAKYCYHCKKPILDGDEGQTHEGTPLHRGCYEKRFHPKCYVCRHPLPSICAGQFEYYVHPFWAHKYCPSHEQDGSLSCYSCELLRPHDTKYLELNDGRILCVGCNDSAVMDTDQCQPLKLEILKFYEGLNMKVEQEVPLSLVGKQALIEASEGEEDVPFRKEDTWGLCFLEEERVRTEYRNRQALVFQEGNESIWCRASEPYKVVTPCKVTRILVLSGLPRLMTGFVIAHEMMHAWLWLNGFRAMRLEVEEGMCQVMGYKWLESKLGARPDKASRESSNTAVAPTSSSLSSFEGMLGKFFMHRTMTDPDPIYGNGFRAALLAVEKHGLEETLDHIMNTGIFPDDII